MITIFTDGASRGNPGPGGWAAIIADSNKIKEIGNAEKNTTNNRMELTAVIEALGSSSNLKPKIKNPESIIVHTDSSYVLNGATKWLYGWQKNNWKSKTKKPILNKDLWVKLGKLLQGKNIQWKLVAGHVGVPANERCDTIATSFADGFRPKLYSGVVEGYGIDLEVTGPTKTKHLKPKSSKSKPYSYVSSVGGVIKTHFTWAECEKRVKGVSGARFKKAFSAEDEASIIDSWKRV